MAKFADYYSDREAQDIMEAFIERFPDMFAGFDTSKIGFVTTKATKGKKALPKHPIVMHRVKYPFDVWAAKTYICEVMNAMWKDMDKKRRNIAVFRAMCAIPEGAFDEQSKEYGKLLQPDIKMFFREFAATGGVPNWMENPDAKDPMDAKASSIPRPKGRVKPEAAIPDDKVPVKPEDIAKV